MGVNLISHGFAIPVAPSTLVKRCISHSEAVVEEMTVLLAVLFHPSTVATKAFIALGELKIWPAGLSHPMSYHGIGAPSLKPHAMRAWKDSVIHQPISFSKPRGAMIRSLMAKKYAHSSG